jgi:hypothetical protein
MHFVVCSFGSFQCFRSSREQLSLVFDLSTSSDNSGITELGLELFVLFFS